MSVRDSDAPEFTCEMCGDHFATEEELKDHVWEYHELDGDVPP
ncbi:hypothetical protein [Haloferax profundi]|nr:hypothetical protein [Haloferax profundi]